MRARFAYRAWRARLRDQQFEIALMRALVNPGELVADVGANKGAFVYWLRRSVGRAGRVLAYEPQPGLAAYLRRACDEFGWSNVRVQEVALSNRAGTGVLHVPGAADSPGASLESSVLAKAPGGRIDCRVETLDEQLKDLGRLGFLKVDVEGHELAVFQGAAGTLTRDRPHLLFECEARHLTTHTMADVFSYVMRLGYTGFLLLGRSLLPVNEFRPDIHQRRDGPRFWKDRNYCNNFLFVAEETPLSAIPGLGRSRADRHGA